MRVTAKARRSMGTFFRDFILSLIHISAGLRKQLGEQRPGAGQQAVLNAGLIGPRRDMDGDLRHGVSIIAYRAVNPDRRRPGGDNICPFMKGLS